jgi:hypothetical protein
MKYYSAYVGAAALLFAPVSAGGRQGEAAPSSSTSSLLRRRHRKNRDLQQSQPQYYDERCFGYPPADNDDVPCDPQTFGNCFDEQPMCAPNYETAILKGSVAECNFMVSYNNVTGGISPCIGWQVSCCD